MPFLSCPMRRLSHLLGAIFVLGSCMAHAAETADTSALLAKALRETLDSVVPVPSPSAPRSEPAGEVAIEFAEGSKPVAALAEAVRLEQEGKWARAAALYQHLIDRTPNALCRRGARLYVPIRAYAEERLAGFPPEGIAEYRLQADREAERLYRSAVAQAAPRAFEVVADRFLLSSRGDDALARLATAWLARGEYGRAMRAWRRLLRLCRDTDLPLRTVAAKVAVCLRMLGRAGAAHSLLERMDALLGAKATVTLGGKPMTLAEVAELVRRLRPPAPRGAGAPVRPGRLLWSDALPSKAAVYRTFTLPTHARWADGRGYGPAIEIGPAVTERAVVYPSRMAILSRGLDTGRLLWEWPWPWKAASGAAAAPVGLAENTIGRWSCSVAHGLVLCSLPMRRVLSRTEARTTGRLVAVALATGRSAWSRRAAGGLPAPLGDGYFVCPPLVAGDRLVAALRAGQSGQEHYLSCFRASDGALLWRTYICGRDARPTDLRGRHQPSFESSPAVSDGLVVNCAGNGVIAAVELPTGRLRWLCRYDQMTDRRRRRIRRRNDAWQDATPRIAGGVVYATPRDSDFLYAIDLNSGRLLWRRDREDYRYLVAVRGERIYLAGARAACLNSRGELEWEAELPNAVVGRPALAGHVLHLPINGGLIFLDADTGGALDYLSWSAWQDGQPRSFGADIASGDLLVVWGKLLVTTPFSLNVFEPLRSREAIERKLAERPEDAVAHYAVARERQWEGSGADAAKAFERALELAARDPTLLPEATVKDIHRRLAVCYEAAARRHEEGRRIDLALRDALAALHHAPEVETRCRLRLRAAEYHRRLHHWKEAVATYQRVLADAEPGGRHWQAARRGQRILIRAAGRGPYAEAEGAARAALERGTGDAWQLVVRYYPNSRAAPAALVRLASSAQERGGAAAARLHLHRLVRDYPEAPEAPEAIYRLAAGYARAGARAMARGALAALRKAHPGWRKLVDGQQAAANADPDAFLAAHAPARPPGTAAPSSRPPLRVAWRAAPQYGALELHLAGKPRGPAGQLYLLSGAAVASRATSDGSLRWADRPGWIGISIDDADRSEGGVAVLTVYGNTPGAEAGIRRGDIIVGFNDKAIQNCAQLMATCSGQRAGSPARLRVLRGGRPRLLEFTLAERPSQPEDPQLQSHAWLGAEAGVVLVRRPTRVDAFDEKTGERLWTFALDEPDPQAASHPGARAALVAPGLAAVGDSRGRIVALDPATGRLLWTAHLLEPTIHHLALTEHGLVVASSRPPTLSVLSPFDGRHLYRVVEPHTLAPPVFALDSQSKVCYAVGATLGCYHLAGERTLWRTQLANFTAKQLWVAGGRVVVHGTDRRGIEVLECRRLASGDPVWAVSLARGETMRRALVEADAFFGVFRRGGRARVRRLDAATGKPAWSHEFSRAESLTGWASWGASLCLGVTLAGDQGIRSAFIVVLDKASGEPRQRLAIGAGSVAELRRIGEALYAVVETTQAEMDPRERLFRPVGVPPRFHVVRIDGTR